MHLSVWKVASRSDRKRCHRARRLVRRELVVIGFGLVSDHGQSSFGQILKLVVIGPAPSGRTQVRSRLAMFSGGDSSLNLGCYGWARDAHTICFLANIGAGGTTFRPNRSLERQCRTKFPTRAPRASARTNIGAIDVCSGPSKSAPLRAPSSNSHWHLGHSLVPRPLLGVELGRFCKFRSDFGQSYLDDPLRGCSCPQFGQFLSRIRPK